MDPFYEIKKIQRVLRQVRSKVISINGSQEELSRASQVPSKSHSGLFFPKQSHTVTYSQRARLARSNSRASLAASERLAVSGDLLSGNGSGSGETQILPSPLRKCGTNFLETFGQITLTIWKIDDPELDSKCRRPRESPQVPSLAMRAAFELGKLGAIDVNEDDEYDEEAWYSTVPMFLRRYVLYQHIVQICIERLTFPKLIEGMIKICHQYGCTYQKMCLIEHHMLISPPTTLDDFGRHYHLCSKHPRLFISCLVNILTLSQARKSGFAKFVEALPPHLSTVLEARAIEMFIFEQDSDHPIVSVTYLSRTEHWISRQLVLGMRQMRAKARALSAHPLAAPDRLELHMLHRIVACGPDQVPVQLNTTTWVNLYLYHILLGLPEYNDIVLDWDHWIRSKAESGAVHSIHQAASVLEWTLEYPEEGLRKLLDRLTHCGLWRLKEWLLQGLVAVLEEDAKDESPINPDASPESGKRTCPPSVEWARRRLIECQKFMEGERIKPWDLCNSIDDIVLYPDDSIICSSYLSDDDDLDDRQEEHWSLIHTPRRKSMTRPNPILASQSPTPRLRSPGQRLPNLDTPLARRYRSQEQSRASSTSSNDWPDAGDLDDAIDSDDDDDDELAMLPGRHPSPTAAAKKGGLRPASLNSRCWFGKAGYVSPRSSSSSNDSQPASRKRPRRRKSIVYQSKRRRSTICSEGSFDGESSMDSLSEDDWDSDASAGWGAGSDRHGSWEDSDGEYVDPLQRTGATDEGVILHHRMAMASHCVERHVVKVTSIRIAANQEYNCQDDKCAPLLSQASRSRSLALSLDQDDKLQAPASAESRQDPGYLRRGPCLALIVTAEHSTPICGIFTEMSEPTIRVVIVGAGYAGLGVASTLFKSAGPQVSITLVSDRNYGLHSVAVPRAMVDPSILDQICFPLTEPGVFRKGWYGGGARGKIVFGRLARVDDGKIAIHKPTTEALNGSAAAQQWDAAETELEYDFLVLALGSNYDFPFKSTYFAREAFLGQIRQAIEDVKAASKVLVGGGGPVGIEIATEIKAVYPDKAVTLVHGQKELMETTGASEAFRKGLHDKVLQLGVELVLDEKLVASDGSKISYATGSKTYRTASGTHQFSADVAFSCFGAQPNTQPLKQGHLAEAITDRSLIRVNDAFQVLGHDNIFALGDAADADTLKLSFIAGKQSDAVASNLLAVINDRLASTKRFVPKNDPMPKQSGFIGLVAMGKEKGIGEVAGIVVGDFIVRNLKGRTMLADKLKGTYGPPK
ncbi:uncharacterized protein BJ171DRAFT_564603 [Polychytrium aggregatum]|uniref:uncharacterized protein n=1 Tax=Polychytrium aggregatum TaxID=110093 RepID=UPI0022FE151F|nr:uncharacterized protein BJ171DRAFT_564603 [Polychytrium aggregatum]KAI9209417.1 hypothetical protein BJ171DRAFT_564603 [Polychytrium aggregatum]